MKPELPKFYQTEQDVFDLFVKIYGRYPKDQQELKEVSGFCSPLIEWESEETFLKRIRP